MVKLIIVGVIAAVILGFVVTILSMAGCETWRQKHRDTRREERLNRSVECKVVEVIDGARFSVAWGPRDKKRREVFLQGVEIPTQVQDEARENLSRLISGGTVRVDYRSSGIFSSGDEPEEVDRVELEASTPIEGIVYGPGNVCIQVEQLFAGLAKCNDKANDVMKAAEKAARKKQIGVWK